MKYIRLTKEQLEELHPEFITFLATQSIDKKEWDVLKETKPEIAEQEIDVFSDLIWDRALTNINFIDHFSEDYIFLFKCVGTTVFSYVINATSQDVNFLSAEGINWLSENITTSEVEIQKGKKDISIDRNGSLFEIIKQGGIISKGELFTKLEFLLNQ
ncbi:DUF6495 family protein [Flavobacterium sp. NRK F10]|uniref:Histidyl-tRNA synthetase n=1 Tax=Flavobacterium sediminis TaxID=2201181 RepID=A0A2U8QXJ8_9FLAO|nr:MULTISPECIES: DUF6495 family protein [Flavobacterium]AWM14525.1 hypothetical protein DI487_12095 [Flavobacterium sediminis]MCO6175758.1 DUF6495 family protein [Flavobacterium sp. NRK F10]